MIRKAVKRALPYAAMFGGGWYISMSGWTWDRTVNAIPFASEVLGIVAEVIGTL